MRFVRQSLYRCGPELDGPEEPQHAGDERSTCRPAIAAPAADLDQYDTVFVGFPVVESVYGAEGVLVATISNIPFNLFIYTLGVALINGSTKGMNIKSAISPPLIATFVAIAFFLTGWELPAPVVECFSVLSAGTVPVSMLVVGASLAPCR